MNCLLTQSRAEGHTQGSAEASQRSLKVEINEIVTTTVNGAIKAMFNPELDIMMEEKLGQATQKLQSIFVEAKTGDLQEIQEVIDDLLCQQQSTCDKLKKQLMQTEDIAHTPLLQGSSLQSFHNMQKFCETLTQSTAPLPQFYNKVLDPSSLHSFVRNCIANSALSFLR